MTILAIVLFIGVVVMIGLSVHFEVRSIQFENELHSEEQAHRITAGELLELKTVLDAVRAEYAAHLTHEHRTPVLTQPGGDLGTSVVVS